MVLLILLIVNKVFYPTFLTFFIFFHKNAFYSWGQRFYIYDHTPFLHLLSHSQFLSFPFSLILTLYLCLSVPLFVCLSVSLYFCLFLCLCLSISLSLFPQSLCVPLSPCLSVSQSRAVHIRTSIPRGAGLSSGPLFVASLPLLLLLLLRLSVAAAFHSSIARSVSQEQPMMTMQRKFHRLHQMLSSIRRLSFISRQSVLTNERSCRCIFEEDCFTLMLFAIQ